LLRLFETAKQRKVCPNILFADAKTATGGINSYSTRRASSNDTHQGIAKRLLAVEASVQSIRQFINIRL